MGFHNYLFRLSLKTLRKLLINPCIFCGKPHDVYKWEYHKMLQKMCNCSDAKLQFHTPEYFTRTIWQSVERVSIPWMVYKWFLSIYMLIVWVLSFTGYNRESANTSKYFIYLTNWSFTLLALQIMAGTGLVTHRFCAERLSKKPPEELVMTKVPFMYKFYWVMYSICQPVAVVVTVVFWAAVYHPEKNPLDVINISSHVLNTVVTLFDFSLCGHPYRFLHFYWTLLYALLYLIFSVVYYLAGGTDVHNEPYIYEILDWRSPGKAAITCTGVFMFLFVVHILIWGLQKAKEATSRRIWAKRAGRYAQGQENLGLDVKSGKPVV